MNDKSVFPKDIDSRCFMSDADLEHVDLLHQYQNLIRNHRYGDASRLLESSDSFYYGAYLFNMFEHRLYQIGQYVLNKKDKAELGYYQTEVPVLPKKGTYWIA